MGAIAQFTYMVLFSYSFFLEGLTVNNHHWGIVTLSS